MVERGGASTSGSGRPRSDLADLLGAEPPAGLAALTDEEIDRLAAAIVEASRLHHEQVDRAEGDVVRYVPLPLRGAVKRLLG